MIFSEFLDRSLDVERIKCALGRPDKQFIVVYGRRRIGKSSLIRQVLDVSKDLYFLTDQTSEANQRYLFSSLVATRITGFDKAVYQDWEAFFIALNNQLQERTVVCIDEFPYMVKNCPALPSILQKLLNLRILKFDLVLCGSSQQMMYDYILDKKSPLYGLADEIIKLKPIPAGFVCDALGCDEEDAVSEYAVWGGIPRYWELRADYPDLLTAIDKLLLDTRGMLMEEPARLLHDDMRDIVQTSTLLSIIGNGAAKLSEIAGRCGKNATEITEPLKKLRELGYVRREVPFGENERNSKKGLYFVNDNIFKFHYKFIAPNASLLEIGAGAVVMKMIRSQFASYVGGCWEELCRQYVGGNEIDGITYNVASRWWGKIFPNDNPDGKRVELDVVAESIDRKHLLIGECKWAENENLEAVASRLEKLIPYLPFRKRQKVHVVIFSKKAGTAGGDVVLAPGDILGLRR